jgi:hypothetical protein
MKGAIPSKCQENTSRGFTSLRVAGANPRTRLSRECTSVAASQGALVSQDTLTATREIQKPQNNLYEPREKLKCTMTTKK